MSDLFDLDQRPQSLEEKLAPPAKSSGGRAMASFEQLTKRYGQLDLVILKGMSVETWRHTGGSGLSARFELVDSKPRSR